MSAQEGQTYTGRSAAVRYANLVKLPHTLFALPFALVGVVLASREAPVTLGAVLWVAVAFGALPPWGSTGSPTVMWMR